jgi:hypothetical protein
MPSLATTTLRSAVGVRSIKPLLFETFGGFSLGMMDLLRRLDHLSSELLTPAEYREASWSTG